jgi:hypothetical protein
VSGVEGSGEYPVYLLVADDEGFVRRFARLPVGTRSQYAPVTVTNNASSRLQLLVAIEAPDDLPVIAEMDNMKTDTFFARLAKELAERNIPARVAIKPFALR